MDPQYPGYVQPNQPPQQFYNQPQGFVQPNQGYIQPNPQQQCLIQPQQQCYMQQPQPCYMQQTDYLQPQQQCYVQNQQSCYMQPQQQCYMQQPQQCYIQPQQQCCRPQQQCCVQSQQQQCCMQPQQFYNQQSCTQQQENTQQDCYEEQTQSRQIDSPSSRGSSSSGSQPIAYANQSWNTSPIQQITGKPCGSVRPQFYFVFTPDMFTEKVNPWTAEMWLHSFNSLPLEMKMSVVSQSKIEKPEQKPEIQNQPHKPHKPKNNNTKVHISKPTKEENLPINSKSEIFKFESIAQFQKLRHHATVNSALQQLRELATDLSFVKPNSFTPDSNSCFICCNSYVTERYKLGVGPINDAITVAANHKYMGYTVYFIHNQHHTLFLEYLRIFLQKVDKYLTVFFAGHGAQVVDTSGDESDGYDEVMVFDSGYIVDDDLAIYLQKYSLGKAHTILLSDCCHSGTIWDIPEDIRKAKSFPANLMSVSSSSDSQTSKQTELDSNLQGVFTFNLWTLVRNKPSITVVEAQKILNHEMRMYKQEFVMYPTRKEMLTKPLFPLMMKRN